MDDEIEILLAATTKLQLVKVWSLAYNAFIKEGCSWYKILSFRTLYNTDLEATKELLDSGGFYPV